MSNSSIPNSFTMYTTTSGFVKKFPSSEILSEDVDGENIAAIPLTQKGLPSGVATLDVYGKIPSNQLGPGTVQSVAGKTGVVTLSANDVGAEPEFTKNDGFNLLLGTAIGTVAKGDHTHDLSELTYTNSTPQLPSANIPPQTSMVIDDGNMNQIVRAIEAKLLDLFAWRATLDVTTGKIPLGQLPTGTDNLSVALGDHTHSSFGYVTPPSSLQEAYTVGDGVISINDTPKPLVVKSTFGPNDVQACLAFKDSFNNTNASIQPNGRIICKNLTITQPTRLKLIKTLGQPVQNGIMQWDNTPEIIQGAINVQNSNTVIINETGVYYVQYVMTHEPYDADFKYTNEYGCNAFIVHSGSSYLRGRSSNHINQQDGIPSEQYSTSYNASTIIDAAIGDTIHVAVNAYGHTPTWSGGDLNHRTCELNILKLF